MNTKQRPLVYYWIAEFNDNTKLNQFDLDTYLEHAFKDINQDKLIKFTLIPFTKQLADGVTSKGNEARCIPFLPKYEININSDRRLIYYRDVFISQEEYHLCRKCNKEFYYVKDKIQTIKSIYPSPICPNCGAHDIFKCKSCSKIYERFEDAPFHMCKCGAHLERIRLTSGRFGKEKRWIDYYLGYQSTISGKNIKFLMKILENGDCEII